MSTNEWYETLKDLTAGTIGGCAGIVVGQPLDTIKVRLQAQGTSAASTASSYNGPIDALVKMVRFEGPRSLFKGLMPPLIGNAPMNAIAFGAYGNANRLLEPHMPNILAPRGPLFSTEELQKSVPLHEQEAMLQTLREKVSGGLTMEQLQRASNYASDVATPNFGRLFLSGCWSGLLQCLATTPAELIKCKLQAQEEGQRVYKGVWDCGVQMVKQKGWRLGLFTGWWATVWRDTPGMGAYFVAYELAKWALRTDTYTATVVPATPQSSSSLALPMSVDWRHTVSYSTPCLLASGAMAGIATWIVTYPFDTIKSVIQTLPDNAQRHEFKMKYIAETNYRKYGYSFFFRGLATTLIRAVPVNAATFLLYEESLKAFKYLE